VAHNMRTCTHTLCRAFCISFKNVQCQKFQVYSHNSAVVSERGVTLSCLLEGSLVAAMPWRLQLCAVLGCSCCKLSGICYTYICVWTGISQHVQPKVLCTCMQVHVEMTDDLNDKCYCTVQLCCLCV
jgi:hypothetical protein